MSKLSNQKKCLCSEFHKNDIGRTVTQNDFNNYRLSRYQDGAIFHTKKSNSVSLTNNKIYLN